MGVHFSPPLVDRRLTQASRAAIEAHIEELIAMLDDEDGDCDLEEGNDLEAVNEDGEGDVSPLLPRYRTDQSEGPTNLAAGYRAWQQNC